MVDIVREWGRAKGLWPLALAGGNVTGGRSDSTKDDMGRVVMLSFERRKQIRKGAKSISQALINPFELSRNAKCDARWWRNGDSLQ